VAESQNAWLTRPPAPPLAQIVERYIGYRLTGHSAGVHRGLPSRHLTFIVSIGPEIDVIAQTDRVQSPGRYRCVLSGLQASHALIAHDGHQEGVAIELTPVGCRALFGLPAAALWNTSVELSDVAGPVGAELWERLQEAITWHERFGIVDAVLCRLLRDDPLEPALRRAWQLVADSGGTTPVGEMARTIGWTRQHLARRFAGEFGLTPKLAARVVRFERARQMIESTPPLVSIAQVAAVCGYYDQAHLTRDFVALAGCPPGRLADGDLPSVQDADRTGARA
jgi:AraC-like DNA-binding protein